MNSLLILLTVVGAALAAPSGGQSSAPTTLADCVTRSQSGPSDEMKAKFEGFKTCAKACFQGSGVAVSAQDKAAMTCFKAAKEDNMAFFKQSSEIQAAKTAFLSCASKTCSATPLPKPADADHTSHHGAQTFDPTNPEHKHMCAMGLMMKAAKAAGASRPQFSADQKTALHTCMEKCHPDHPEAAQSSQSSHHRRGGPHHGRKHNTCLKHFCTKANFETCKSSFAAAKPAAEAHFTAEFASTCSCLQKIGGTVDCSGPSDATCSAVFEEMHKMWQSKKHTSST